LAVTFPVRMGSMRCLSEFTRRKKLILVANVKGGFVPRIRDEIFPAMPLGQPKLPLPIRTNPPEKKEPRDGASR
jgi:hypothetical protein